MKKRVLILSIAILILLSSQLLCTDFDKSKLPKTLTTSIGKEFYFSFLPCWETQNPSGDLRIYVISNLKTKVTVEVIGKGFSETKYTDSLKITEFVLSPEIGQTYQRNPWSPPEPEKVFRGAGVHITSDDPILCYAMTRIKYSSEGFIVLPVNTVGNNYILSTFPDVATNSGQWLPAMFAVTATQDKTKLLFTMGGTDWSKTVGGQLPGEKTSWNLNAGDVFLVSSLGHNADLSGSIINASKPVAIVSGSYGTYVPTNCGCANILEEMELPTNLWGTEYFVPHIYPKQKSSIIKIFPKEPKTNIYKNSQLIGMINHAGGVLNSGHLELRADSVARTVVYSGDKPISISLFNSGYSDDLIHGDPFKMTLVPTELFQSKATFINPEKHEIVNFPDNYVTIIYQANDSNEIPDDFEIAYVKDKKFFWEKLSKYSPGSGTKIQYEDSSKKYCYKSIKLTDNGIYKLKAENQFQAYSHGLVSNDAYGFASFVGESEFKVAPVDTIAPVAIVLDEDCGYFFGNVYDSTNQLGFNSNISTIYMETDKSRNFRLIHSDFMPCEDSLVSWNLERIDKNADAYASLMFLDCRGNSNHFIVDYKDTNQFMLKDNKYDFGKIKCGVDSMMEFFVYNKLSTHPALIDDIKYLSSGNINSLKNFTLLDKNGNSDFTFPILIPPSDSVKFTILFNSNELNTFLDTLVFADDCNFEIKFGLKAITKVSIISTDDIDFKENSIGKSKIDHLILRNTGNYKLEIYNIQLPELTGNLNNQEYKIFSSDEIKSLNISTSNPLIILPGEPKEFEIIFRPDSAKEYIDSIIISSNTIELLFAPDSVSIVKGIGDAGIDVSESNFEELNIFPNPANDIIQIDNIPLNCKEIILFDEEGKKVRAIDLRNSAISLKISTKDLAQGVYTIRIYSNRNIIDKKIIIER